MGGQVQGNTGEDLTLYLHSPLFSLTAYGFRSLAVSFDHRQRKFNFSYSVCGDSHFGSVKLFPTNQSFLYVFLSPSGWELYLGIIFLRTKVTISVPLALGNASLVFTLHDAVKQIVIKTLLWPVATSVNRIQSNLARGLWYRITTCCCADLGNTGCAAVDDRARKATWELGCLVRQGYEMYHSHFSPLPKLNKL